MLEHAVPLGITPAQIRIGWPPSSTLNNQFTDADLATLIQQARGGRTEPPTPVLIEHESPEAANRPTLAAQETANRTRRLRTLVQDSRNDSRVQQAMQILGAHIREVRVPDHLK